MRLKFIFTFLLAVVPLFQSCDRLCKKMTEDYVVLQNNTNRALELSICRGKIPGEKEISIPQDSLLNEISLGQHESSEVRGGPTASCSGVQNDRMIFDISLSSKSFGQVKLCFDQSTRKHALVEVHQTCPTGFIEQTSATNCPAL